ncbi:MAG: NAD-dependent dihydropyrimidine dehydrogenase subunit PreA [Candidatus Humimicrobiaceae bacterium]
MVKRMDLSIDFCGVKCENPFFLASSPISSNYEMCKKALETGWGGIVYKTIGYWIPQECSPRFDATRKESTAFIGFKNMEMISDKPTEKNLEMIHKLKRDYPDKVLVASIMGENEGEWAKLAKAVTEVGADIIEMNLSCPQMAISSMGSDVGSNPELVEKYCKTVRGATNIPVLAKMTPNITFMELAARAAVRGGADGISAINTIKSITEVDLDIYSGLPVVNGKSSISGYSGKAVKPVALRFIAQMSKDPLLKGILISGIGGIETWDDAVQFLLVGASNLQVCTAVMQYGYRIVEDMISGLSYWMKEKDIHSLQEIVGAALPNIVPVEQIERDFMVHPHFNHEKCIGCGRCVISCSDGGHQAINWISEKRKPVLDKEKCVGCGLCGLICPIEKCITPGEIEFHSFGKPRDIKTIAKKLG